MLGQGAYGVVHKSKWLELECAVETFTASKKTELEKDAAILENLKHPNILQLIFCTIQPKSCSLVLELMSIDLNKFIQGRISPDNKVPFTLPVALDIMLQIARGLKYIHERGVGHRDIKPSNILMTPTPVPELVEMGYVEVKLADFGMTKAKLMNCTTRSQTANVGTPVSRAPELFDGADAKVSHRVWPDQSDKN